MPVNCELLLHTQSLYMEQNGELFTNIMGGVELLTHVSAQ